MYLFIFVRIMNLKKAVLRRVLPLFYIDLILKTEYFLMHYER